MAYRKYLKRPLDVIFSFTGLIVLSPFLLIAVIVLFIGFKENPFFFQKRTGKNERLFSLVKFKTMNSKKDSEGNLLADTDRLTPLGIFFRKTSIDELPQLLNVLKGDMSIIGPRPLLPKYLPYYTKEERERFLVRPGITGLAQVTGRNFISWEGKFKKDVEYINNLTLITDIRILCSTIQKVFRSEGIEVDPKSNPDMLPLDVLRKKSINS